MTTVPQRTLYIFKKILPLVQQSAFCAPSIQYVGYVHTRGFNAIVENTVEDCWRLLDKRENFFKIQSSLWYSYTIMSDANKNFFSFYFLIFDIFPISRQLDITTITIIAIKIIPIFITYSPSSLRIMNIRTCSSKHCNSSSGTMTWCSISKGILWNSARNLLN